MKASVKWMQRYAKDLPALQVPVDDLAAKIGGQLGAIESIENLGEKYQGIIVSKIISVQDHPNADRLHVVMIDDGGKAQNVARDERGYVQVVCGAPNLYEGMMVPWLPPGTTVPESVGKEPFVLEARDMRGVVSNGMLASARELALGTDHTGIVDVAVDGAKPGADFAQLLELDDYIIDIENKMFTHRPDLFGQLGVAREIAGIQQQAFHSPAWYVESPTVPQPANESLKVSVQNELPNLVPRFVIVPMSGVTIKPSPLWLQAYLLRVGIRPINNVVDVTNYYMMLTAQPLHAYDYDKVKAHSNGEAALAVRYPKPGEKLKLLNGKEIEPRSEAMMIATDKELIGVGGVMGGGDTEVDDNTTNIILECGTFDMYSIRRTSMAHGLFTDAVTRFNKGQSPLQNLAVVLKAAADITEYSGGQLAGPVQDLNQELDRRWVHPPVPVSVPYINDRLGLRLSADDMKHLLENVEFSVDVSGDNLTVTAPFWRTDIELREDVVEEVGRLHGYDKLPLDLPKRTLKPAQKSDLFELKSRIRRQLARSGANEVLTYSFVHGNLLDAAGQDTSKAFKISNAISPDLQYYRLSLTPSLLDRVHPNIKTGYTEFALFELGKTHNKDERDNDNLPVEHDVLAVVYANAKLADPGAAYYEIRAFLEALRGTSELDLNDLEIVPFGESGDQRDAPFEPGRSAQLQVAGSAERVGVIGELKASVRQKLKLPEHTAAFELDLRAFQPQPKVKYEHIPRFPKVTQDISLKVTADVAYDAVYEAVKDALQDRPGHTIFTLEPLDIYQRPDDTAHKQITLRLSIASYERTLTDAEVAELLDQAAAAVKEKLGAERL